MNYKVRITTTLLSAILFTVCIRTNADEIVPANGQSAPTTILDTAVLDRNARTITKKLTRELEDYLGE